ncbi:hypothetical protein D8682_26515 [Buttiauxella sp. 3AFRM03]|nr:hypothetical protein D8682_01240 [Buttiauxella sp. 3AFRM03]AYN30220.1 hypothetical protein D8682_26515 [Buttiauxella sp. 3AFRM03]
MNATESNAIRATARKCWGDIESAWQKEGARNAHERSAIYLRILGEYARKVAPLYTRTHLIYWMGIANGTLKEH